MGGNINKETRITIQRNGAMHPHEPIHPSHTNHSIRQLGQAKWIEEMTTKINNIAPVVVKPTSNMFWLHKDYKSLVVY